MSDPKPDASKRLELPPRPDMPDCCAGGCATCVLMDYADEMAAWRAECAKIEAAAKLSPNRH
jgi:hypothetical protein